MEVRLCMLQRKTACVGCQEVCWSLMADGRKGFAALAPRSSLEQVAHPATQVSGRIALPAAPDPRVRGQLLGRRPRGRVLVQSAEAKGGCQPTAMHATFWPRAGLNSRYHAEVSKRVGVLDPVLGLVRELVVAHLGQIRVQVDQPVQRGLLVRLRQRVPVQGDLEHGQGH
jgi:hypothetical protein